MLILLLLLLLPEHSAAPGSSPSARLGATAAPEDNLARLPPLGWSSWNVFAGEIDEQKILQTIEAMQRLRPFGYEYVNIDDNWQSMQRAVNGSLLPNNETFPHGIAFLAEQAQVRGLKLGIYSARGNQTCQGRPGSLGHYEIDAATFAAWGVQYLKLDSCGGNGPYGSMGGMVEQYRMMRDALKVYSTVRPIYYSICPYIGLSPSVKAALSSPSCCGCMAGRNECGPPLHADQPCSGAYTLTNFMANESGPALNPEYPVESLAHSVLVEWKNNVNVFKREVPKGAPTPHGPNKLGYCEGWLTNFDAAQDLTWGSLQGPGHWNDFDMLTVGCNNATTNNTRPGPCQGYQSLVEQRAQFSLWCMLSSPLILGHDVRYMDEDIFKMITNRDLILLQQDTIGHQAEIVRQTPGTRAQQVLLKRLNESSSPRAVALFNREDVAATIELQRADLRLTSSSRLNSIRSSCDCVRLVDLETKAEVVAKHCSEGTLYSPRVLPHQAIVLRVFCTGGQQETAAQALKTDDRSMHGRTSMSLRRPV